MSDFTLYNYFRSSTSYRARIALHLKGISFDYKPVHLLNNGGEQHSASYKALNPMEGVPTLIHNGKVISQTMAIVEYLDEVYPEKPLFPHDPYLKAKVRQICQAVNCDIHPLTNLKVTQFLENEFGFNESKKTYWTQHWISKGLAGLENTLRATAGKFAVGDSITAADAFIIPQIFSAKRFNVDLATFSTIRKITENCENLEAFKKAHPFRQPDTPSENRLN